MSHTQRLRDKNLIVNSKMITANERITAPSDKFVLRSGSTLVSLGKPQPWKENETKRKKKF